MGVPDPVGMRAWVPGWWRGEGGPFGSALDALLWPAEGLFALTTRVRNAAYDAGLFRARAAPIPVVSVGNLSVGGTGKTPFTAWLAGRLQNRGHRPAVVLRGYAEDEVMLHRELNPAVPVLTAVRRVDAVRAAAGQGCDVAVLDDAFQHRALSRELDVVLVAADSWTRRRRLLPRGPWREPLSALARAGLVVVTRKATSLEQAQHVADELARWVPTEQIAICRLEPTALAPLHGGPPEPVERIRGRRVLAVAALGDPEPFARQLRDAGAEVELIAFPDHHPFRHGDAGMLLRRAAGRTLIMTRKDAVKLREWIAPDAGALLLDQRLELERGGDALDLALARVVNG